MVDQLYFDQWENELFLSLSKLPKVIPANSNKFRGFQNDEPIPELCRNDSNSTSATEISKLLNRIEKPTQEGIQLSE
jgi:hypothetical protein